jgi:hypothetical protein
MTMFAVFDPFDQAPQCASIGEFLVHWDRQTHSDAGSAYVYAFLDGAHSIFYIGKGQGNRAHDADAHRHGRLGYYVAKFLGGSYAVDILRSGLSRDDAELLEAQLIEVFGRQLVNWAGNLGPMLTAEAVAQMRENVDALRKRARAAAAEGRLEEAVSVSEEALARLSAWERTQHETEVRDLELLAVTSLAARVDLQQARSDYVPHAPVLACECLSDLTRYLCALGRAQDARREVKAFTERYPHRSFVEYEFYDHRYGRTIKVAVTKREQATLRRVERAIAKPCGQECEGDG